MEPLKIILLSGCPGSGKTTVANLLESQFGYFGVHLGDLVLKHGLYITSDEARDTKVIDSSRLNQFVLELLRGRGGYVVCESHYADVIDHPGVAMGFVLRVHPDQVFDRLAPRRYQLKKVQENAEAEFLGDCTSYMLEKEKLFEAKLLFEIDTTHKTPPEIASLMHQIIQNPQQYPAYLAGNLSWLSDDSVQIHKFLRG